jgi:hypothetical protein
MREGPTSRVMAADRPYGEFMIFTASVRNILDTPSYKSWQNSCLAIPHDDDTQFPYTSVPVTKCLSKAAVIHSHEAEGFQCDKAAVFRVMIKGKFYICVFQNYCLLDVTMQSLIDIYQCVRETCCLHPYCIQEPCSTVKMWMQVHKKWGQCNIKERCSQKVYNLFLISNFRRVLNVVCFLLGDSPASVV